MVFAMVGCATIAIYELCIEYIELKATILNEKFHVRVFFFALYTVYTRIDVWTLWFLCMEGVLRIAMKICLASAWWPKSPISIPHQIFYYTNKLYYMVLVR